MSKKVITILLLLVLSCTMLSGCALNPISRAINKVSKEIKQEKENKANEDKLSSLKNDSKYSMSEDTKKSQQLAIYAQERKNQKHTFLTQWFYDMSSDLMTANYDAKKAGDTAYWNSVKAEEEEDEEKSAENKKVIIVIVVIILVLGAILALAFILKKPAPEPAPVSEPVSSSGLQMQECQVDYERLLHKNCDKLGLNYDTVLADNNGDAREAVNVTNQMMY